MRSNNPAAAAGAPLPAAPAPPTTAGDHQPTASSSDDRGALLAALSDALAGALGSVVAVAVFYPIDIAKTRAQASSSSPSSLPLSTTNNAPDNHPAEGGALDRSSGSAGEPSTVPCIGTQRGGRSRRWFRSRTLAALVSIVKKEGGLTRLYEGIEAKALQALLGSFVYFYAYAFIKGAMRRRAAIGSGTVPGIGSAPKPLRPSLNLLAAAMAGAVNQAFTLPLENITTRMQTGTQHTVVEKSDDDVCADEAGERREEAEMSGDGGYGGRREGSGRGDVRGTPAVASIRGGSGGSDGGDGGGGGGGGGGGSDGGGGGGDGGGGKSDADDTCRETNAARNATTASAGAVVRPPPSRPQYGDAKTRDPNNSNSNSSGLPREERSEKQTRRRPRQSVAKVTGDLYREGGGIRRFWRGFVPSLILTCNPAINYTAFDMLKALWLRRRRPPGGPPTSLRARGGGGEGAAPGFLNPLEAFLVAAAAKSLATLITYPLIRAKVVLMTSSSSTSGDQNNNAGPAVAPCARWPTSEGQRRGSRGDGPAEVGDDSDDALGKKNAATTITGTDAGGLGSVAAADLGGGGIPVYEGGHSAHGDEVNADSSVRPMPQREEAFADSTGAVATVRGPRGGDARGMGKVMLEIFRREGLGGLYAGCGAQLLHTILKSALLLATKEQIARAAASAVFLGGSSSSSGSSRGVIAGVTNRPQASR